MNRRAFLSGLIAAPAVIRVAPLMRIAPVPLFTPWQAWSIEYLKFDDHDMLVGVRTSASAANARATWKAVRDAFIPGGLKAHRITHDEHAAMMGNLFAGMAELPSPLS